MATLLTSRREVPNEFRRRLTFALAMVIALFSLTFVRLWGQGSSLGGLAKALPFLGGGNSSSNTDGDKAIVSLNARVDRVRDELAADIGQLEDNILRALERFDPDAKIIQADRPSQKRLP